MDYREAVPLPEVCRNCKERIACLARKEGEWCCDECDHLMDRFIPVELDRWTESL